MIGHIRALIAETDQWRVEHASHRRFIEAAACAIRLRALRDALAVGEAGHAQS